MTRVLFVFLLLLGSVWLGIQLNHDPGYLLIAINKWTIETTLWVALFALFLFFLFMYVLFSFTKWLLWLPVSWKHWRENRRVKKARAKTRRGLIEFSEGHWEEAKINLIKAIPNSEAPLLNYLTAARAAQEMGENDLRDGYLREAQQSIPEAKIAVELTQAQLQLDNQQWEQARVTLKHLKKSSPRHPYVLRLLKRLYEEVHEWQQLILILPELQRNEILSGRDFENYQACIYLQATKELIREDSGEQIHTWMRRLPRNLRNNPDLIGQYSEYLIRAGESKQAEILIRRSLNKEFNERLVTLYSQIKNSDIKLNFAESLLKTHPHSAVLLLTLGRLSIANNLWGKARSYLEDSIRYAPTADAYLELGALLERVNDHPAACEAYRQGLLMSCNR